MVRFFSTEPTTSYLPAQGFLGLAIGPWGLPELSALGPIKKVSTPRRALGRTRTGVGGKDTWEIEERCLDGEGRGCVDKRGRGPGRGESEAGRKRQD